MISLRHASDYLPKLVEQQPENGLALAFGPAQALGIAEEGSMSKGGMFLLNAEGPKEVEAVRELGGWSRHRNRRLLSNPASAYP